MTFDVFLAYAAEDQDMAALVARRLRALKFKVRFNKKGESLVFDEKDTRDILKSSSVLVMWSEAALASDWVRAAGAIGHSRDGTLLHVALDETIPYEPFRHDKRFDLIGFTSRTSVEGWYEAVDELGRRDGRKDLREWSDIPNADENAKSDWLARHPADPLAEHAKALRDRKLGIAPAPAPGAAAAAANMASAIGAAGPQATMPAPAKSVGIKEPREGGFDWLVAVILLAIGLLFLAGYFFRSSALTEPACDCVAQLAVHNGTGTLEHGTVIDDTGQY